MKLAAMALGLVMMATVAMASPLTDAIIGVVFLGTGGVLEGLRAGAKSDREETEKKAVDHLTKAIIADENAMYYLGAANWEFINFGNTASYRSLYNTSITYGIVANREASDGSRFATESEDHQDKQNLYKGVSLTAFGIGSVFMVKAAITYMIDRNETASAPKKYQWAKNLDIVPTNDLSGAKVQWEHRF